MQIVKVLATFTAACSLAVAKPIDTTDSLGPLVGTQNDEAPRCGYVRLHEDDSYIVGVYSRGTCEPIWRQQEATFFRIDTGGCACRFFGSNESCQNSDPVEAYIGPSRAERKFDGEKPTYVKCERA